MADHHASGMQRAAPRPQRVERGARVDPYWMDETYHVRDWNRYGFAEPRHDQRWIRHYDDALLIDRYGAVHDGRYGMDWDSYGGDCDYERCASDYADEGDHHRDGADYGYADEHDGGYDHEGRGGQGYGYAQGPYGYGYYGYGAIVTETTVTTSPTVVETVYYDEVAPAKRHYKRKKYYRAPTKIVRHRGGKF